MVVALFGGAGVVFGVVQWLRRDLASPQTLASIQPAVKTLVYDARGRVIHEFYKENRSPVPLKQIPRHIVNATIATEDRRFYSHWGIDLWGIARAAVTDIMQMRRAQGGSTITQLLARNLFLSHERTFSRKIKEAALAIEIERTYSKDQILEMYFNQIYFGEGAYGVEAGAKTLFNKPLRELNLQESALLAGIPANPSLYSPRRRPAAARARREKVLRNMLVTKAISQVEYDNAVRAPLGVTPVRYSNDRAPYFIEMVRLQLDEKFGSNAVYEGGLRVYTTLDLDLQQIGERALEKHLAALESELKIKQKRESFVPAISDSTRSGRTPYLQGALIAIDPRTGYVRAMVGGRDWNHSNFNRATQAQRQPGSSFKPFVYVAAIDNGFHPTDVIVDEPVSFPGGNGKAYQPLNYDRKFRGPVTLRYALQQSINIPAIKLMRKVGISLVASYARRLGIRTPLGSQNLSLALGSSEVTLIDLTTAYGVFANRGIRNDPLLILKVEDDKGTVLEKNTPHPVEVLSEETASVMTSMLQSVMDHGTGFPSRTRGFTNPAAGKTGTMDDYMDAWFVGYTPALSCGVWVGFDQKRTIGPGMTGARAALPVWTDFMIGATRGRPIDEFPLPVGTVTREICAETGMLATTACVSVTSEMFGEGSEPSELCTQHPGPPLRPLEPGVTPAPESHGPTDTERAPEDPVGVR
ncbi:MAG: PBP1A family penicillin-binding protein [Candidatus Eisenbacteria bacterium]|uniref:peptidoglycan glycosyltransferase n=1 Tax=Eiseniibacteriota bacterium TaxID=2212470 RepID=A0A849SM08_UNCEI|nr:PBP1A family penicillin-binding protein [Candidatus Eisenbacteria bacterium]